MINTLESRGTEILMSQFVSAVPGREELTIAYGVIKGVKIPVAPDIVLQLDKEVKKESPSIDNIVKLISHDTATAGKVLKTINSPFFGIPKEIDSILHATMLLGIRNLNNMVIVEAIKEAFIQVDKVFKNIWDKSFLIAEIATILSAQFPEVSSDKIYMLGLFHACGILVFIKKDKNYAELIAQNTPVSALIQYEQQHYHTEHAVVGTLLAMGWKLPMIISQSIYHQRIKDTQLLEDKELRLMISLIKISNKLYEMLDLSETTTVEERNGLIMDNFQSILDNQALLEELGVNISDLKAEA